MRYLYVFVLLCIFLHACKPNYDAPCRAVHIDSLNLSSAELAINPYTNSTMDSAWFISDAQDTILTVNTCWNTFYQTLAKPVNPECPDDSFGYETLQVCMGDSLNKFPFQTKLDHKAGIFQLDYTGNKVLFSFDEFMIPIDSVEGAYPVMILGSDTFQNVHGKQTDMGDSLYYNTQYGILRILNQNTVKWRVWKR